MTHLTHQLLKLNHVNICSLDGSNLTLLTPTLEASVSVSDFMFVLISVLLPPSSSLAQERVLVVIRTQQVPH